MSTAAVASLIVGLLSCLAMLDWMLVAIPVIGIPLSTFAWCKVKRHRDELTGEPLARGWPGLVAVVRWSLGPALADLRSI